jgi:hypothetical protein
MSDEFKFASDALANPGVAAIDPTPHVVPTVSEIHTISTGPMTDHVRSWQCWCQPQQHAEDGRIWIHRTQEEIAALLQAATTAPPG